MKKTKLFANIGAVSLLISMISGCGPASSSASSYIPLDDGSKTILIYMCGSDLETKYAAASSNINEMLSADIPDNVNLLIQTGGAKKWRHHDISSTNLSRYMIKNHKLELLETLPDASMGDQDVLHSFINFAYENYPSEDTSIIFWDHGGASLNGVCFDENHNFDSLSLVEIDQVLNETTKNRKKFDFIGFDACLMGNIETATIISNYADNMIASEDSEPLGGWDYTTWIKDYALYDDYMSIIDSYIAKCNKNHNKNCSLTHIDFEYFDEIVKGYESLIAKFNTMPLKDIVIAVNDSLGFGELFYKNNLSNLFDMYHVAYNVGCEETIEALSNYLAYASMGYTGKARGLAMYYPLGRVDTSYQRYLTLPVNQKYKDFLNANYSNISNDLIKITNLGEYKDNQFISTISDDSFKYLKDVSYKLMAYQKNKDELIDTFCLGYDADVTNIKGGIYSPNLNNRWISFNDNFISLTLIHLSNNIGTFETPLSINGKKSTLKFTYDYDKHQFDILGYLPTSETQSSRRLPLVYGDKVTILYDDRSLNDGTNLKEGATFIYDGNKSKFEIQNLDYYYYSCYLEFVDIFDNKYRSYALVFDYTNNTFNYIDINKDLTKDSVIPG